MLSTVAAAARGLQHAALPCPSLPVHTRLPACLAVAGAEEPMLQRRIEELEGMAHAEAGQEFSLSSPQEVGLVVKGVQGRRREGASALA